jgi:anti-sigma factor RsiW
VDVRDRLFKAIARARIDGRVGAVSRRRRIWSALAAAGLLAGGTWLGVRAVSEHTDTGPDPLGAIAEDHLRSQRHTGLTSADSLEVARWLGERVPFPVAIPLFPDARMTGARLLLANGRSGAVVDYLIAGRPLSYYVLPAALGGSTSEAIQVTSRGGYRIAAWEEGGLTHALVAGLPGPKLVELAHYCIAQTTGRRLLSTADGAPAFPLTRW